MLIAVKKKQDTLQKILAKNYLFIGVLLEKDGI